MDGHAEVSLRTGQLTRINYFSRLRALSQAGRCDDQALVKASGLRPPSRFLSRPAAPDKVFTVFFGFVAVDFMTLLSLLCLIKDRKEKERYRLIDQKKGYAGF